jgi:hypothetical protein
LNFLKIIARFAADAKLVSLDLGLNTLWPFVPKKLVDLLGVLLRDTLFDFAFDAEFFTGCKGLSIIQALQGNAALNKF